MGRVGPQGPGAHIGAPLQALKQLIFEKTEGTPFFMEEIVQELVEQGILVRDAVGAGLALPTEGAASSAPTDLHIPTTVQGVLPPASTASHQTRKPCCNSSRSLAESSR